MKKSLVIICLIIASCNQVNYTPKPEPFLSKNKMAAIMTDLYLIEGVFSTNQTAFLKTGTLPHKFIYKKHKVDSLIFQKNFAYYADRPEDYQEILEITNQHLEKQKEKIENKLLQEREKKENTTVSDSLIEVVPITN